MSAGKRVALNSAFLFCLTISNYVVGLLLFPFISRTLSVEGFGLVGFGMAYALIFQTIVEYGFMISITAYISRNRNNKGEISKILSGAMLAKLFLAALATIAFAVSAMFVQPLKEHPLMMTLFFLSAIVAAMMPDFYFRGIEQMKYIAIRAVITKLLSVFFVIALVRDDADIAVVPAALLIGNLIALGTAFILIRNDGIKLQKTKIRDAWLYIRKGFFLFLSRVAVSINQSLGMFMLGFKHSPASQDIGMFAAATRISSAAEMMTIPVSDSLYPHMINKRDYRLFRKVYISGLIAWFFTCTFIFIFAESICSILLGPAYTAAGNLLRILMIGTFMAFSSNLFGYNTLAPIGLTRHANLAILVSLGINLVAVSILYFTDHVSTTSIAIVVALTNVVIFGYRVTVLYRNRRLIKNQ